MAASHMDRGLGERKLKEIIKKYPNIMKENWSRDEFIKKIKDVDGFSDKLAENILGMILLYSSICYPQIF